MNIHQRFVAMTLIFALSTASIYGQNAYGQSTCGQNTCGPQEEDECACFPNAYEESSRTTHWSVFIPIVAIVGAAIWFGLADEKKEKSSSGSQDGLGSIANSKRVSRHSSSSSFYSYKSHKHQNNIPVKTLSGSHSH